MSQRAFSFLFRSGSLATLALLTAFCGCDDGRRNIKLPPKIDDAARSAPTPASETAPLAIETLEIGGRQVAVGPKRALFNGENLDGWTNLE